MKLGRQNMKICLVPLLLLMAWLISSSVKILAQLRVREKGWRRMEARKKVVTTRKKGRNGRLMVRVRGASSPRGTRAIFYAMDPIMQNITQRGRSLLLLGPMMIKPL